ncbi:uncharacterized protein isoform X2 [Choristoneura fumiferana]|uniref:uncharacterized protein isoform X2 n=1 Tax=Choristoneura fumiferana TaxID=7141 RepID=UPI003D153AE9
MSDKSFGDHMSRGIVKNPLLSTAVTGLSIEDLTQNAVLLPVSRNQALLGGQEQSGTQNFTLAHPDNLTPNIPSGDANFTPIHPTPPPAIAQTQYVSQQNAKNSKTFENTTATACNAQPKSEDDFDVNEYFARLQGTRYVSAPINSHLKEDTNATLEAKEENLEEINLNEPSSTMPEEQQSITADIAQNFSQLPTVLPQVASAVFSSFSNMLSMKSREHTPEEVRTYNVQHTSETMKTYQHVQESTGVGVPLMGVSEIKEVAPPPREPPVCGPGNFRMTSKKKVYAQIPGLSSGETVQMPTYAPPAFNQQYFTPSTQTSVNYPNVDANAPIADAPEVNIDTNVFNNVPNIPDEIKPSVFEAPKAVEAKPLATAQFNVEKSNPDVPIIPPPPMFSNLAKRDSLLGTEKAVLPPSVARRISLNKHAINTEAPTFTNYSNMFVPAPISPEDSQTLAATYPPNVSQTSQLTLAQTDKSMPPSSAIFTSQEPPSQPFLPASSMPKAPSVPSTRTLPPPPMYASIAPSSAPSFASISSFAAGSLPRLTLMSDTASAGIHTLPPANLPPPPINTLQPAMSAPYSASIPSITPRSLLNQAAFTSLNASSKTSAVSQPPTFAESQPMPPSIFTPDNSGLAKKSSVPESTNISSLASESKPAPPMIPSPAQVFNPYSPGITSESISQTSSSGMTSQVSSNFSMLDPKHSSTPATELKLPEPPKATGNTNFRMTKKRPQYYSGPIEGIGAISNNVVPTIAPVAANTFQSALFTPETGYQGSMLAPEPVVINDPNNIETSYHGAVITPDSVTEKANAHAAGTGYNSALEQNYAAPTAQCAFDISTQGEAATFDSNKSSKAYNPNYNTAFDMSRQVTDNYEPPKESAFGIIGSLKSKLNSLDINKIQNSVTTFFDPAYNDKPEAAKEYEANKYAQHQSGIEIFVPTVETHAQPYSYDAYNVNFTYGQSSIPNPTNYYQQQVHNVYSPESYYTQPVYGTQNYAQEPAQQSYQSPNVTYETTAATGFTNVDNNVNMTGYTSPCWHTDVVNDKEPNSTLAANEPEKFEAVNPNTDISNRSQPQKQKNIEQILENLKNKDEAESSAKQEDLTGDLNVNINENQHSYEKYDTKSPALDERDDYSLKESFEGVPEHKKVVEYYDSYGKDDNNKEYGYEKKVEITSLFSMPLHDLSSNIASKSQEIYDEVSEEGQQVSFNTDDDKNINDRSNNANVMTMFDSGDEDSFKDDNAQTSDLNICETCREFSKPEEKEADLTSQLIENITSPIQLLNPVEAPLSESVSDIPVDIDTLNQCAEISLIADETVETLQVQSATELLDEENPDIERNYGWRNEVFPPGQDLLDPDYTFKPTPNTIGFFGDNSLFFDNIPNNASDEIKAELIVSQDEIPVVLQGKMSTPTAPPLEDSDDAKSDETGILDVQSIEKDANKDFPVFEEFVIEPSETDDDKIETRDKSDDVKDTFTNRVDRFVKLKSSDDLTQQKDINFSNTAAIMPSYFDTGNYAVETHYRNSLTSPTFTTKSSESNVPFRIPPGFENQYGLKSPDNSKIIEPKIPETFTQTSTTTTSTFSAMRANLTTSTVPASMPSVTQEVTEPKLPDFASVFGGNIVTGGGDKLIDAIDAQSTEPALDTVKPKENIAKDKVEEKVMESLPDPINFFGSATQEANAPETVNRLASYFASPPKTDNTKSFFELSQGQDHYRQKDIKDGGDKKDHKPFFELSQSQDHYKKEDANIPLEKHLANLNLMNDLTSFQNIEPSKDHVVRTVNYFTVEYDDDTLNYNKGEPSAKYFKKPDLNKNIVNAKIEKPLLEDVDKLKEIVNNCKYCCELNIGPILTISDTFDSLGKPKYRQAMDSGSDKPKDEVNIMPGKEGEISVNVKMEDVSPDGDNNEGVAIMNENRSTTEYEPVKHHWFYRVDWEGKSTWRGFSINDSKAIENAFHSPDLHEGTLVPTDGGRYDVNVMGRLRIAVYWADKPTNVRRCSWFYKGTTDARYVPYTEPVAEKLEEEYRHGITTGEWHRRLVLPNSELVVMHGPAVMVHFLHGGGADAFSAPNQSTMRPRVVRRGFDESEIEDMEPSNIDHLLLLCHGVGSACDMRFRSVEEVVDDFRATSLQLLQSHYRNSCDAGVVGRVETILNTVCGELNRVYSLFKARNPSFKGGVSLGGHSLGSVILYDLLCHQDPPTPTDPPMKRPEKQYLAGTADINPNMKYPKLCFEPLSLYALGSPIAIFECIRGVESLGNDFFLPTCRNFFNIFHPYDPIAYRIEPLVNPQLQNVKPSLIPHHKGRKRMHLELKETMARVGADLKQKLMESIKNTWSSMWATTAPPPDHQLEKVVEEEIEKEQMEEDNPSKEDAMQADVAVGDMLGKLNDGRRVDYVLQEAPFEMINEYLFAMSSHVCYWESEDTMLLILREIYDSLGVQADVTVPQQSMTVQRNAAATSSDEKFPCSEVPSTSRNDS